MGKKWFSRLLLLVTAVCILLPAALLLVWSVTGRWPWPRLTPETYTLRTLRELLFGSISLLQLLGSSVALAGATAVLSTAVAVLTARATELYRFPGRSLARFCGLLPLLIPGTVFAIGVHLVFLRLGLADTVAGVLLVHLVTALPYAIAILTDVTAAVGANLEEQAAVLGAGPLSAFRWATLPRLVPGILSSLSMAFTLSYSQYFSTLIVGGGRVRTLAMVLVPYIQSGDRPLASAYAAVFTGSALLVFALFEWAIHRLERRGEL